MTYEQQRPLHTGKVEGSIPSVPTTKALDLQGFSENQPSGHTTQTDGTVREHDATGRGGDVEVCSAAVLAEIPTTAKAFRLWLIQQGWREWPIDLHGKACCAYQAMDISERAPDSWQHSAETRRLNLADWQAFTTAYADWRAQS